MYDSLRGPTIALAVALSLGLGLMMEAASLPDGSAYSSSWPDTTAYMELRVGQAREAGERLDLRYRPVRPGEIPDHLRRAVRVAEDAAFYQHPGIDVHELKSALAEAWREKRMPRGASTITQQLARNLYLSPARTLTRKAREAVIAFRMEAELSKARIFDLYLNVIELGDGIFGVQAASTRYFGRPVERLSRRQAAMLAATIPSPRSDNPDTESREFRWRTGLIYRRAFGRDPEPNTGTPAPDSARPYPAEDGTLPAADSVNFSGIPLDTVPSTGGS